jgi:hypothetical protein
MHVDVAVDMDDADDVANGMSDDVDAKMADDMAADMDFSNHFQPTKISTIFSP